VHIETARLLLRRFTADDVEPLASILLHPEVVRWLGPPSATSTDVRLAPERYDRHWDERGYGRFAVCDRTSGTLVGRAGVMHEAAWTASACKDEIGWAIDHGRWGEGLATEAAAAALRDAFERVGLEQVVSYTRRQNGASIRVMEKLGLERRGAVVWEGSEHVWYSIGADRIARLPGVRPKADTSPIARLA
jgi:RimJ/RimL family protein N-acetyltransferase